MTDPWAALGSASVLTTLGTLPSQVSGRLPLWYQVSQSLRAFVAYIHYRGNKFRFAISVDVG